MYKRFRYIKNTLGLSFSSEIDSSLELKVNADPKKQSGKVNVEFSLDDRTEVKFSLTSVMGKVVCLVKDTYNAGKNCIDISTNQLAKGVYFLEVMLDGRAFVKKVFVG